jgi:hypothetical protein
MPSERRTGGVRPRGTLDGFGVACRSLGGMLARHAHTLVVTSDVPVTANRQVVEGYVEWVGKHATGGGHQIEVVSPAE